MWPRIVGKVQHRVLDRQADLLEQRGERESAVAVAARALRALERAYGAAHPDVGAAQARLAVRCARLGQWARAGLLVEQAAGASDGARLALGLGDAYAAQPRDAAAEAVLEALFARHADLPRPTVDGQGWGERFARMGARLADLGRPRLAQRFLVRALALYASEGAAAATREPAREQLAALHEQLGEHAAAESLLRGAIVAALSLEQAAPRPDPQRLADLYRRLAEACQRQRKYVEMEDAYRRAIAASDEAFGADSQRVVPLLWPLAGFYRRSGRLAEAELLYRRIFQNAQPHPPLDVLDRLAAIHEAEGRWGEAEDMLRRMRAFLAGQRADDDPPDPDEAAVAARLAIALRRQQRQEEAAPLLAEAETRFQTALVRCARDHGPASPEMARLLEVQVLLLRETGRGGEAAQAEARLRAIRGM